MVPKNITSALTHCIPLWGHLMEKENDKACLTLFCLFLFSILHVRLGSRWRFHGMQACLEWRRDSILSSMVEKTTFGLARPFIGTFYFSYLLLCCIVQWMQNKCIALAVIMHAWADHVCVKIRPLWSFSLVKYIGDFNLDESNQL